MKISILSCMVFLGFATCLNACGNDDSAADIMTFAESWRTTGSNDDEVGTVLSKGLIKEGYTKDR